MSVKAKCIAYFKMYEIPDFFTSNMKVKIVVRDGFKTVE